MQPDDQSTQPLPAIQPPASPAVPDAEKDAASSQTAETASDDTKDADVKELEWDALIPKDWRPETLFDQYNVDEISDDDPRAQKLLDKLKALWKEAPVVPELEGQRVKLPGFVVPLEMETDRIEQFLLVPYYGACIHVPPPPSNQSIYVVTRKDKAYIGKLFDTVWVTGTIPYRRACRCMPCL
ncbi:MAG: DUF3299 domain-containing protein, partial [Chromatiales bacterium]